MTDVLRIALDRRAQLHEEVAKLDEFIRMAETLMRSSRDVPGGSEAVAAVPATPESVQATARTVLRRPTNDDAGESADAARPSIIRRSANAAG